MVPYIPVGTTQALGGDLSGCPRWAAQMGCQSPRVIWDPRGQSLPVSLPRRENPALTSARMQQGCKWRLKKPNRRFVSVFCLTKMKNKKIPNKLRHIQKKIQFFFFFFLMEAGVVALFWYFGHLHINCSVMALPSFSSVCC